MKKQILLSAVLACISVFSAAAQKEPVDYVNPLWVLLITVRQTPEH